MSRSVEEALRVLGVAADSDPATVAHAYRRLARATHPDVSPDPDAARRFATVTAAYRLVADRDRSEPGARQDRGAGTVAAREHTDEPAQVVLMRRWLAAIRPDDQAPARTVLGASRFTVARPRVQVPILAGPLLVRASRSDQAPDTPGNGHG
jgi:hypothetical protein